MLCSLFHKFQCAAYDGRGVEGVEAWHWGVSHERSKKNARNLIPQLISIVVRQVPKHLHSLVSGIISHKHKYTIIIQCDTNRKLQPFQAVSCWTLTE